MPTVAVFEPTTEQVVGAVAALLDGTTPYVIDVHGATANDVAKLLTSQNVGYTTWERVEPYLAALADVGVLHVTRRRRCRTTYYRTIGS